MTAVICAAIVGLIAVVSSACSPTPTERNETTHEVAAETVVKLFDPSQRLPDFNVIARLFDPGISDKDYESIRQFFFRELIEPDIGQTYDRTATWNEFKRLTGRPAVSASTGLHSDAARELVVWFVERDRITIGSSKDDVLRIQGTPDAIADAEWRYGTSHVYFAGDKVTKWDVSPLSPLKVKLRPSAGAPRPEFANWRFEGRSLSCPGAPNQFYRINMEIC